MDLENLETQLDRDELLSWKEERITKMFFGEIKDGIRQRYIASGNAQLLDPENPNKTQTELAKLIGNIEILQELLQFYTGKEAE